MAAGDRGRAAGRSPTGFKGGREGGGGPWCRKVGRVVGALSVCGGPWWLVAGREGVAHCARCLVPPPPPQPPSPHPRLKGRPWTRTMSVPVGTAPTQHTAPAPTGLLPVIYRTHDSGRFYLQHMVPPIYTQIVGEVRLSSLWARPNNNNHTLT